MQVSSYAQNVVAPKFKGNEVQNSGNLLTKTENPKSDEQNLKKEGYSGKEVTGIALATALSAMTIAGGIMHGKSSKVIKSLERHVSDLTSQSGNLRNKVVQLTADNNDLNVRVTELNKKNELLNEANTRLSAEAEKVKKQLKNILESGINSDDSNVIGRVRTSLDSAKLDYDLESPPITGQKAYERHNSGLEFPSKHVPTTNRSHIRELNVPEISESGHFKFEIPTSDEMKVVHSETVDFTPLKSVSTSISESYADSVQWDNNKIARDVMQNFFDGHGQTLDGVKILFEPTSNGKFKVRIEGKSTYTPDKAIYIGESTKRNDPKAAGHYGEGLKMAVLKLLRDKGAEGVKIGSDNWELAYNLEKTDLSDKRVLSYSLDKVDKYDGNYVEFETSDKDLLETFRKTINRFYSSGNTHFKNPDFENDTFGVKVLPDPNSKGALYIAGQRFEMDGDYDGLKGVALFLKEKPPVKVLDPSRDRTSINQSQLNSIAEWLSRDKTSQDDKLKLIKALDRYMDQIDDTTQMDDFLNRFVYYSDTGIRRIPNTNFPENYVAYSNCDPEVVRTLVSNGYRVCKASFNYIGMRTISDVMGSARKHIPIKPDEVQRKKILILKEALKKLAPSLKGKHFTSSELDSHIYMFSKNNPAENRMYSKVLAEAITDPGVSKGFWLEKGYLDSANFSDVLETALHELSHKAGGDGSASFSYKLTDVNKCAISQILNNAETRKELQALNILWQNLSEV